MSFSRIKQAVLRFGLTALAFLLLVLLSAAVEATISLPVAAGLGVLDIVLMNLVCGLLSRPARQSLRARRKASHRAAPIQLQVVPGGHAA